MKREMTDTPEDVGTQEIVHRMERTACALGVVLSISDVMKLTGKCYNTTKRYFPFKGQYVSKVNVAHRLAELGHMT